MCNCICGWKYFTEIATEMHCPRCGKTTFCDGKTIPKFMAEPERLWPCWATAIGRLRQPDDTGVGDTFARIVAPLGGEQIKKLAKRLGMPCGCADRQLEWNQRWPYPPPTPPTL